MSELNLPEDEEQKIISMYDEDWEQHEKDVRMNKASILQPKPSHNGVSITDQVIEDLNSRREFGIKKYGGELTTNNNRDSLWDAYQEALDLCLYLRQELLERANQ